MVKFSLAGTLVTLFFLFMNFVPNTSSRHSWCSQFVCVSVFIKAVIEKYLLFLSCLPNLVVKSISFLDSWSLSKTFVMGPWQERMLSVKFLYVQGVSRAGELSSVPFLTSVTPERSKIRALQWGEQTEARQRNTASYHFENSPERGPRLSHAPHLANMRKSLQAELV